MSTNIFNNSDFFNFKTGDRPSQSDFKNLFLNLQSNFVPGEYKLINKNFPINDNRWVKITPEFSSSLSGSYSSYIFGNTFVNIASSTSYDKLGLYEIIGPVGKDNNNDNLFSQLGYSWGPDFNRQYSFLNDAILLSIKKESLTGIEANSVVPFSFVNVISGINLAFREFIEPPYEEPWYYNHSQSFYINNKKNVFNAIFEDYGLDKILSYIDTPTERLSCFQSLPTYILPNFLSFDIDRLFLNIGDYDSYITIQNLVNSLSQNTVPQGIGLRKRDLFYISQLSGFESLATYTLDTSSFNYNPYNDIISNDFINFNSLYFSPTATLSGILVDPASPFSQNIPFVLNNLSLSANFYPGDYLIINYYPFLSSVVSNATFPRSAAFSNDNIWAGLPGLVRPYFCLRNTLSSRFFPVCLFNILCAASNYNYKVSNQLNVGAAVIADNYQVKTNISNGNNQEDLWQGSLVKSNYAKLTGNYLANNPILSNFYVDFVALTGFIDEPLHLSSFNGDVAIWKLDPEYFDNIITLFDIPSSFYSHSPILSSLFPDYIPADTTMWLDIDSRASALTSLTVPAHVLNLSSFFNLDSDKFRYYFEMDVPKYNLVGAPFYDQLPVFGINHPLTGEGVFTDEYYYQYQYTIIPPEWNIMSYWSSVSTLPVSGSQFFSLTSNPIVVGNTDYAFLSTDYTISYSHGLTSAQQIFTGLVPLEILDKSIIKRRNNKILPFSLAVYGMVRPDTYFKSFALLGDKKPFLSEYFNRTAIVNSEPTSAFSLNYLYMQNAWHNKIYKLHNYFTNFTNFLPGTANNNVDHFSILSTNPAVTSIGELTLPPISLDKGSCPYFYSAFKKNFLNYENLISTKSFTVPILSSLNNLLIQNEIDLYIFTGLSGTNYFTNLTSFEIVMDNNGGCLQIDEETPTSVFADPEKIFNKDNTIDYRLSSFTIGLSSISDVNNELQIGYENYFQPVSVYKEKTFSLKCNEILRDVEVTRTDFFNLSSEEFVYFANTLYFYISTSSIIDWDYLYGDSFPNETYLLKKFGLDVNLTNITLSGLYYTPLEYSNFNSNYSSMELPFLTNNVTIITSKRRSRALLSSFSMSLSSAVIIQQQILPPYPK